jgi:hypothetical protein
MLDTNAEIELEYVSTLAKAQRAAEGRSTAEAMNMLMPLAELKPQILDKINEDEYADYIWEIHGAPTKLLNAEAVVKKIREQRDAAIAEQQQKEESMLMMEGAAKLGKMEAGAGPLQ